mmetsp:Transcript_19402/g.33371  ORF Transcript_19402/g.33371 Transcript_19402/m.33371 type:complete len:216 (+) Transcript_19402:303-950(+)
MFCITFKFCQNSLMSMMLRPRFHTRQFTFRCLVMCTVFHISWKCIEAMQAAIVDEFRLAVRAKRKLSAIDTAVQKSAGSGTQRGVPLTLQEACQRHHRNRRIDEFAPGARTRVELPPRRQALCHYSQLFAVMLARLETTAEVRRNARMPAAQLVHTIHLVGKRAHCRCEALVGEIVARPLHYYRLSVECGVKRIFRMTVCERRHHATRVLFVLKQ